MTLLRTLLVTQMLTLSSNKCKGLTDSIDAQLTFSIRVRYSLRHLMVAGSLENTVISEFMISCLRNHDISCSL